MALELINYTVGRPWYPDTINNEIGCYMHFNSQVFNGTIAEAWELANKLSAKLTPDDLMNRGTYRVYQLVERTE